MKVRPSSLDYLKLCPCFDYKETGMTSEEGSTMHKAAETGDDSQLETDEQLAQVTKARELVEVYKSALGYVPGDPNFIELKETRVRLHNKLNGSLDWGLIAIKQRSAVILDHKFGRAGLVVDNAYDSLQLGSYYDGFMNTPEFHSEANFGGPVQIIHPLQDIDQVEVVLAAPRTEEILSHVYKTTDYPDVCARIDRVVAEADDPFKKPRPVEALCMKCANAHRCTALVTALAAPSTAISLCDPSAILLAPVESLTEEEVAKNYAFIQVMENYNETRKEALKTHIFAHSLNIPFYSMREKKGSIKVMDNAGAWELLKNALTPEQFVSCCGALSVKKVSDLMAVTSKSEARSEIEAILEPVLTRGPDVRYLQRQAKLPPERILRDAN